MASKVNANTSSNTRAPLVPGSVNDGDNYWSPNVDWNQFYQGITPAPVSVQPGSNTTQQQLQQIRAVPPNSYAPNYPNLGYTPQGYAAHLASQQGGGLPPNYDFSDRLPPERFPTTVNGGPANGLSQALSTLGQLPGMVQALGQVFGPPAPAPSMLPAGAGVAAAAGPRGQPQAAPRPVSPMFGVDALRMTGGASGGLANLITAALRGNRPAAGGALIRQQERSGAMDRPEAKAARDAGQRSYAVGGSGPSTMPTRAMNGNERRTYGDSSGDRYSLL